MAEISRRAAVGMATLYRNFPGRRELLETLYSEEADAICKAAETPGAQAPVASFVCWLRQLFVFFASKRHIASELLKHTDGSDLLPAYRADVSQIANGNAVIGVLGDAHLDVVVRPPSAC